MRTRRSILCILCLALLVPGLLRARTRLPVRTRPLIEAKYGGWSGVLRLWVFEGWQAGAGSAARWLNRCIESFERAHPGVYVQPEYVDASAMAALGEDGLLPPDMALFPPGLMDSPARFMPLSLDGAPAVRAPLAACGRAGGDTYAVPVLAGGYLWAYNADVLDGIPGSWRDAGAAVSAPPDEPWRQWSAALLALCSRRYAGDDAYGSPSAPPGGLDLGLAPGGAAETPAPTPGPEGTLDCALPEGFAPDADALRAFAGGGLAAVPVTQREVRWLEALSDRGRGVDWRLASAGSGAFTDQLLLAAVVRPRPDEAHPERHGLCGAFVAHLLSDACQGALADAGAFSVTGAPSGYAAGDALAIMEQSLRSPALAVPGAFDPLWRADAGAVARRFTSGEAAPAGLWRQLAARLAQTGGR